MLKKDADKEKLFSLAEDLIHEFKRLTWGSEKSPGVIEGSSIRAREDLLTIANAIEIAGESVCARIESLECGLLEHFEGIEKASNTIATYLGQIDRSLGSIEKELENLRDVSKQRG